MIPTKAVKAIIKDEEGRVLLLKRTKREKDVQNYTCKITGPIRLSDEHSAYAYASTEELSAYPVKDESFYEAIKKAL